MSHRITCPSCRHVLRVPDESVAHWLTCPRCLAMVEDQGAIQGPPPQEANAPRSPTPGDAPAPGRGACPGCGRPVETAWEYCPFCREPLLAAPPSRLPTPRRRDLEVEVRRDTSRTGGGLIGLAVLGAIGLFAFVCSGGLQTLLSDPSGAIIILSGIAFALAIFVSIVLLSRRGADRAPPGFKRVVGEAPERGMGTAPAVSAIEEPDEERRPTRGRGSSGIGAVGGAVAAGVGGVMIGVAVALAIVLAFVAMVIHSIASCFETCGKMH